MNEEFVGTVPSYYREVYDVFCPAGDQNISFDLFSGLLEKSNLPSTSIQQIWDLVSSKDQNHATRTGLYKGLALVALAQQNRPISDKSLENYGDSELPKPNLGDLSELKARSIRIRRARNPNELGISFTELCDLDYIKVELLPEKKGIILKHVEYQVTSQKYGRTVLRRYKDFVAFHEVLLLRYPYRLIPRLPPKKSLPSKGFIEHRRLALRRVLLLVCRHPVISEDKLIHFFLTYQGSEPHSKIHKDFGSPPDEFMTSDLALRAKELVPMDAQHQMALSRSHISVLHNSFRNVRSILDRRVASLHSYASDMVELGRELNLLGNDNTNLSSWAYGNNNTWSPLKSTLKQISVEFSTLFDKASSMANKQDLDVLQEVNLMIDFFDSYQDLCIRHQRGVLNDHTRALKGMERMKRRKNSASSSMSQQERVQQLETRILNQESKIADMENRNLFSVYCMQMETQLIHANLDIIFQAIDNLVHLETQTHSELSQVWDHLRPILDNAFPRLAGSRLSSATDNGGSLDRRFLKHMSLPAGDLSDPNHNHFQHSRSSLSPRDSARNSAGIQL